MSSDTFTRPKTAPSLPTGSARIKPHLLSSVVNNLGAQTTIEYAPSTKFYLADKASGTPWLTRLSFPVHVVTKITQGAARTGAEVWLAYE